jgi:hypothetical protein
MINSIDARQAARKWLTEKICALRINVEHGYIPFGVLIVPITTITSREFNEDASRAKQAARKGPVFIMDRGRPAHVLLTIEDYQKLTGPVVNIIDQLAMPGIEDIEFDPPRPSGSAYPPVDLS